MNNATLRNGERISAKRLKQYNITYRVLTIGIILIPINCYWLIQNEAINANIYSTTSSLLFNVIFSLFIVTAFNLLLQKFLPRYTLKPGELLIIYTMLCQASAVSGEATIQLLIPLLGHAFWHATPENEWAQLFHKYIPSWLSVSDKRILLGYYEGESTLYTAEHLKVWLVPLASWAGFLMLIVFIMLCLNVILRKQWMERERLTYPLIQLPFEMSQGVAFFRNRLMWFGFAFAAGIGILNGLHFLYPVVPGLKKIYSLNYLFTQKPWNAITSEGFLIAFYPCAVGLGFFIPLTLSFSCWFFYLFWKAELVLGSIMGLRSLPGFPYPKWQESGAYLGIGALALWSSRRYLLQVFIRAFGGNLVFRFRRNPSRGIDDSTEPMKYRTAIIGCIAASVLLIVFCLKAGMSVWVAIVFFACYLGISLAITRMRAELGPLVHELYYANADQVIIASIGTRQFGPQNLTVLSMFWWITRSHNNNLMPHQLEGFKLVDRSRTSTRWIWQLMLISTALGIVASAWRLLDASYRIGEQKQLVGSTFSRLQGWLYYAKSTDYISVGFMGLGFAFTVFLSFMGRRFLWWPFHPLGYAVTQGDWAIKFLWFPLFLSWLAKRILLKHGGIRMYRQAVPFFLGLILGDFVIGGIWSIIGLVFKIQVYAFKNW